MVHHVKSRSEFNVLVNKAGSKPVLVDFYANWCGPCKLIAPTVEKLSRENPKVIFVKVDVDECEDLAQEFNVTSMPTFILLKDGKKIGESVGASVASLCDLLSKSS